MGFNRLPKEIFHYGALWKLLAPIWWKGVTRWRILPICVYLLKNRPVKQKYARLTQAGVSAGLSIRNPAERKWEKDDG